MIDHICCNLAEVPVAEGTGNFVEIFNTNQERRGLQVSPKGDLTILEARGDHAGKYEELFLHFGAYFLIVTHFLKVDKSNFLKNLVKF